MSRPRHIHYSIERGTMSPRDVDCVLWALSEWERAAKGKLRFVEDSAFADWRFFFAHHPNWPEKIALCTHSDPKAITFDPREKWAVTPWQRFWGTGSCLRTYALHEIGHALGLRHSQNVNSLMHPKPVNARIDVESQKQVLRLLDQ
jgi:hypothetical protein